MYLHKNGIELKKMEEQHLPLMKALKDESWFGTHRITICNQTDQQRWFSGMTNDKQLFLIATDIKTSKEVGVYKIADIDWMSRLYHSGQDVFEEFRGKGYGKLVLEAGVDFGMEILNMNRIDTEVLENNLASQKIITRVGFIQEGVRRNAIHKCGQYLDSYTYGMLRNEWSMLDRVRDYGGVCNLSYQPKNGK